MVGKCGIAPNDFGFLTPRETSIIFNSWFEYKENKELEEWDRVRWQTTCLINIQLKIGDRQSPKKMFPFPWDKKDLQQEVKESTREDFEKLTKKWKNV
jgi:hypothetical protein